MLRLYEELLETHGPQGWWPRLTNHGMHYAPDNFPADPEHRFEIIVGSILTQNTSWSNVEKALRSLHDEEIRTWEDIHACTDLETCIRSSGYYRQKARKLREAAAFFGSREHAPTRDQLLRIWGIGPETADSILCYAYGQPVVVVDAYLRRVLQARGMDVPESYDELRLLVQEGLPEDASILQEFHALIVAEGKSLNT